jgi:DNA repair protein RecO (recombination protein O)
MRYIIFCDSKKVFSFSLPESSMDQLSNITEVYFSTQLERGFSALDFYKTLIFTSDEPYI